MQINKKQNFEFSELVGTGGVSSSYSFSVCVMCESCRRRLSVNIAHECRMSNVDQGRSPASLVMLAPEPEQMKEKERERLRDCESCEMCGALS